MHDALPKYLEKIDTAEQLYNAHLEFERGLNSYLSNKTPERLPVICSQFNEEYEKRLRGNKNLMTRTLEGLSDSNVGNLSDINKEALPDHSCTYDMVAIFKSVDINVLFNNLTMLSNDSLQTFN